MFDTLNISRYALGRQVVTHDSEDLGIALIRIIESRGVHEGHHLVEELEGVSRLDLGGARPQRAADGQF